MIKNIILHDAKNIDGNEIYIYDLIDTNFKKQFKAEVAADSYSLRKVLIANSVLEFVYDEYKHSKECPFKNIKIFYNLKKSQSFNIVYLSDEYIRDTIFYKTHQKIMDKILMPIAIIPTQTNWSGTGAGYYNYTTATTTANITYTITATANAGQWAVLADWVR